MRRFLKFLFFTAVILGLYLLSATPAWANTQNSKSPILHENYGVHENCLSCHSIKTFEGKFQNNETISLYTNHQNMQHLFTLQDGSPDCQGCHEKYSGYPHPNSLEQDISTCSSCHPPDNVGAPPTNLEETTFRLPYANRREMQLALNPVCSNCHQEIAHENQDSIHSQLGQTGNLSAPVCIDCHGGHDVTSPNEPREKISTTCGNCHKAVFSTYQASVHGEALSLKSNKDVPTCVDCHGVHSVQGPHNLSFRNDSITMCGECHGDEALMSKYGISTNVIESYLNDFHGRSVNLFRTSNDARLSSQAVCYDCHGIHNILPPDNPNSMVYPANLQATCQKCHYDTDIKFPEAWLSHYSPDLDTHPVLYIIDLFYPILIIGTLGGMSVYIALDARKRWAERKHKPNKHA